MDSDFLHTRRETYDYGDFQNAAIRTFDRIESQITKLGAQIASIRSNWSTAGDEGGTGITGDDVPSHEEDPLFTQWLPSYRAGPTDIQRDLWDNVATRNSSSVYNYDGDGGDSLWFYRGPGSGLYTTTAADRHRVPALALGEPGDTVSTYYSINDSSTFSYTVPTGEQRPGLIHWIEILLYNIYGTLDNTIYTDYQELRDNPDTTTVKSVMQLIDGLENNVGTRPNTMPSDATIWAQLGNHETDGEGNEPIPYDVGIWPLLTTTYRYQHDFVIGALDNVLENRNPSSYTNTSSLEARIDDLESRVEDLESA